MERYVGLDAHGAISTFGVIGPSGRKLRQDVVETHGAALVKYLRGIPGRKHLCLEEGSHCAWLYDLLSPHVEEIVVAGIGKSHGQKSDVLDAFRCAEDLRTDTIKTRVFKAPRRFSRLRESSRVHSMLVRDVVRVQGRLKAMYCGRGVPTSGNARLRSLVDQWIDLAIELSDLQMEEAKQLAGKQRKRGRELSTVELSDTRSRRVPARWPRVCWSSAESNARAWWSWGKA